MIERIGLAAMDREDDAKLVARFGGTIKQATARWMVYMRVLDSYGPDITDADRERAHRVAMSGGRGIATVK